MIGWLYNIYVFLKASTVSMIFHVEFINKKKRNRYKKKRNKHRTILKPLIFATLKPPRIILLSFSYKKSIFLKLSKTTPYQPFTKACVLISFCNAWCHPNYNQQYLQRDCKIKYLTPNSQICSLGRNPTLFTVHQIVPNTAPTTPNTALSNLDSHRSRARREIWKTKESRSTCACRAHHVLHTHTKGIDLRSVRVTVRESQKARGDCQWRADRHHHNENHRPGGVSVTKLPQSH